jgi:hypothetical protein
MSECCDCTTLPGLLAEVNLNVRETEDGLSVDVTPKDPQKTGFLKDLARGAARLCAPTGAGAACCAEGCC